MFTRLADLITRRYKLIIIAWIVVLFYVFPLIFKINDVVVYSESEAGLEGLEAMRVPPPYPPGLSQNKKC